MNTNEIKALITLLDDDDSEVLQIVRDKLMVENEDALFFLSEALHDKETSLIHKSRIEEVLEESKFKMTMDGLLKWKENGSSDLLEGLCLVALYQYPSLKTEAIQSCIKQFKLETWLEFNENMHPYDQVKTLNHVFFNKLDFKANTKDFHAVNNSMINKIIELRTSNPIGLCCVYMLIAQELGLPIFGVNLPNVFVLTYKHDNIQFYINVFSKGVILTKNELENHVRQLKIEQQDYFFEPCSNLIIIQRILRNLMVSFDKANKPDSLEKVEKLLRAIIK
jgi:regulator of sirC expression with transglutaminase-like and TPR domain